MIKRLASELATSGIQMNATTPGYILTDVSRGGVKNTKWFPIRHVITAMRWIGEAKEVATTAALLCSNAAAR